MNIDIFLEVIKTLVVLIIVIYLYWYNTKTHFSEHDGFRYIQIGFSLLLFASFLDITDNIDGLERYVVVGDTQVQAFLEKVVGYLGSSVFMLIGFWKLLPVFAQLKETQKRLKEEQNSLEITVEKRTKKLQKVNEQLSETLDILNLTQSELIEKEKMAALGDMVAGVAHEINTPVGIGVTASSHLQDELKTLKDTYEKNELTETKFNNFIEMSDEITSMLISNLNRAAELITSFKQVSVDQSSGQIRKFDLKDYLNEIILSLHPKFRKTQHTIEIHCPENLIINSVPGAFSQIINNLVLNSLLHGFENNEDEDFIGRININVTLKEKAENKKQLMIIYTDNGKGMSEQQCSRVFEPFYTTKRGTGGSGLGMCVVYNLVTQKLQGTIQCNCAPETGVCFKIKLPLEE